MTAREWLTASTARLIASGSDSPALDAELLLAFVLGLDRAGLLCQPERPLGAVATTADELLARRITGEPVAYLTGEREFFALPLVVTSDVLVPRPETEHLVEAALERIPTDARATVADLGTGAGGIAVALAVQRPALTLVATDVSSQALAVAARNARRHGVASRIGFRLGPGLAPLAPRETIDLVVANLPYLPSADASDPALAHEPRLALDGGPDGLDIYRRLLTDIANHPQPPKQLLWEIDSRQADAVRALGESSGYDVTLRPDLAGRPRVAVLTR